MTTPAATTLRDLLTAEGAAVHVDGERLTVTGLTAARTGEIARRDDLPLHELTTHEPQPLPRFSDLVGAEWIERRSLRSTWTA